MENGRPNRLLKWKRTGKTLGIMFGITFMIYFAALSYLAEAKLIIPVMVFGKFTSFFFSCNLDVIKSLFSIIWINSLNFFFVVLNIVATTTWLYGLEKVGRFLFEGILKRNLIRNINSVESTHWFIQTVNIFLISNHLIVFFFLQFIIGFIGIWILLTFFFDNLE